ncbi:MAG: OB-fold domain-containing protein [Dehalococcoidia bacterium]
MAYEKPLPQVTKEDRPFWEAARQHRLTLPRCRQCGNVWFPPYCSCPRCLSFDLEWIEASGRGKVWGMIEMVQPYIPAFKDDLPYNVVLVQLEEGPMMFSNVVGIANDAITVDMPVEAVFEDVTDEFTLIKFRPRPKG